MIELAALFVGILTTTLIALTVYTKNKHSITSKLFVLLAVSLIGWSLATYLSLHTSSDDTTLIWTRWTMFFVVCQNTAFFFLVQVFPNQESNCMRKKWCKVAIGYSVLTALVAISPFLFVTFENGAPQPGPGMALFMPHALIFAFGGIVLLVAKLHRAKGVKKVQLQYFLAGTLLLFTVEPLGNFVMPLVFKNSVLVMYSPLYAIVFSGLIAYAIITKRLFDIRTAVARSVGYVLVISALVGIYAVGLFGVVNVVFAGDHRETLRQALSIVLLVVLAVTFQYLKKFFDKITNKIFYREDYDFQDVLNKIGDVVAAEINLSKILNGARDVLSGALKTSFIEFVLIKDGKPHFEVGHQLKPQLKEVGEHLSALRKDFVITDGLETQSPLWQPFQSAHVTICLCLRSQQKIIGYILVGDKRSGEAYSPQDQRLLTIAANELAVAIQNALQFQEIENFNKTLQENVNVATTKLRKSNQKLKTLDETKDEFITMASHQLRTPLTAVKGYLSMVLEGDAGELNENQRKLLEQSFNSSQRMVYLIADLLNLSRLSTGKFVIELSPTNLAEVVQAEVEQLVETAKSREVELNYEMPESFPVIMLDETKIRQVVMNFIDNAIYYTPPGGTITVELRDTASYVEYLVHDTGIGVPKAEQYHLFSKFYRAENARRARPDGTGLGLFMAKKVVVAQGGAIIFQSVEGKGSTFGFRFNKRTHLPPSK